MYSLILLIGIIIGLGFNKFFSFYFLGESQDLASKEDMDKINAKVDEIKSIYKKHSDLSKYDRDFYHGMTRELQDFLAVIKKYELEGGSVEHSGVLNDF